MNKKQIIKKTVDFVKKKMSGEGTGHDWWHIDRVRKNALGIARKEKQGDTFIIELAALTHDLDDWKFRKTSKPVNTIKALKGAGLNQILIDKVLAITENISFKLGTNKKAMNSIEGKIVQDADRLDAIGAIGIARLFAFGGQRGREIHNPNKKLVKYKTVEKLKWSQNTSLHHFEEKLLHIKDRMHTKTAKQMAIRRHEFMKKYINEFLREWSEY